MLDILIDSPMSRLQEKASERFKEINAGNDVLRYMTALQGLMNRGQSTLGPSMAHPEQSNPEQRHREAVQRIVVPGRLPNTQSPKT